MIIDTDGDGDLMGVDEIARSCNLLPLIRLLSLDNVEGGLREPGREIADIEDLSYVLFQHFAHGSDDQDSRPVRQDAFTTL